MTVQRNWSSILGVVYVSANLVGDVLRKNISRIRDRLNPESVLDVFEANNTFGNATESIVRDLREQLTTSDTNRKILELFARRHHRYIELKKALRKTGQCLLLKFLTVTEDFVHEQQNGGRQGCECELCSQAFPPCGDDCYDSLPETISLRDWHLEVVADQVSENPWKFFKELDIYIQVSDLFGPSGNYGYRAKEERIQYTEDNGVEIFTREIDTTTTMDQSKKDNLRAAVFKGRVQKQSLEKEYTLAMLKLWAERKGKRATPAALCRALCASGFHHVTKALNKRNKTPSQ